MLARSFAFRLQQFYPLPNRGGSELSRLFISRLNRSSLTARIFGRQKKSLSFSQIVFSFLSLPKSINRVICSLVSHPSEGHTTTSPGAAPARSSRPPSSAAMLVGAAPSLWASLVAAIAVCRRRVDRYFRPGTSDRWPRFDLTDCGLGFGQAPR